MPPNSEEQKREQTQIQNFKKNEQFLVSSQEQIALLLLTKKNSLFLNVNLKRAKLKIMRPTYQHENVRFPEEVAEDTTHYGRSETILSIFEPNI